MNRNEVFLAPAQHPPRREGACRHPGCNNRVIEQHLDLTYPRPGAGGVEQVHRPDAVVAFCADKHGYIGNSEAPRGPFVLGRFSVEEVPDAPCRFEGKGTI